MTIEQYVRTIEVHDQIKKLASAQSSIRCSHWEVKLSFIKRGKFSNLTHWCICNNMDGIQDILDKHEKMIRQEIEDKIKMLNQEIEKL